jgi:hypothetical protein
MKTPGIPFQYLWLIKQHHEGFDPGETDRRIEVSVSNPRTI